MVGKDVMIPKPSVDGVRDIINRWEADSHAMYKEKALDNLFFITYPKNINGDEITIKLGALNYFYGFRNPKIFELSDHILSLKIDDAIKRGDPNIVNSISRLLINGKERCFYSFSSVYCARHNSKEYPIYDENVKKALVYFKKKDNFYKFSIADLKNYVVFKEVMLKFREYYKLERFNLKQIDKYLWCIGIRYLS